MRCYQSIQNSPDLVQVKHLNQVKGGGHENLTFILILIKVAKVLEILLIFDVFGHKYENLKSALVSSPLVGWLVMLN